MKKPANRLYMALALGAGICLTASCASDDGFAADEGALELQRIEVEGEESITRAEATAITEVDVYATNTAHKAYGDNPLMKFSLKEGVWTPDKQTIMNSTSGDALLYAYYPPAAIQASGDGEHTTAVNLPSSLTDFLATGQADYLYGVGTDTGTAPVTATPSSRTVSFKMKHALAKVSFRIVKSDSATEALKLIQVDVLSGTNRLRTGIGTMNLKSGLLNSLSDISTLTLAQASGVELKLKENQKGPNVTCLVAPMAKEETVLSFRLKVCVDGEAAAKAHAFETQSVTAQWEAGKHYVYLITVDKMGGKLSSVQIEDWKNDANQNTSIGI
ncbi:hypothetical protein M067_2542 [Bacteroides fragilis str. J-143-4]|uniref:fimbrillin family protein n=1 Tax=Bacteroides fragilis TaxID=817 RepID=UPI0004476DB2|nr:fimbrillin family protein [Bacteroides fragilis]EXZ16542.1 hypothetical protein M067_5125 [Bacteroides fragilis str. J-143-4]EXZ17042.1 hypothetical protein M067_4608 [Bacteroides fragilis str. J-143-4]EXZ19105.1 hypothetical protein M067_2542 [Bacteroides fragilis str. J-143-4]